MSTATVAYDPKLAPLADATPLEALPDAFKAVVPEQTVTQKSELAAVRAKLNKWARSLPHHPYQDFGDRVKLLRVQQCHSYWMGFATHFEERALADIERPCSGTAGERAKYSSSSLDPWRFAMPVGKPFAEATFPDRMVADSRTVTTCTGCAGARQVTCDKCNGAKKARCYGCNGNREVTCSGCNGSRQVSCRSCNGAGQTRCSNCGGNGQARCTICLGTGRFPAFNPNSGMCGACGGMGRSPCFSCSSGWKTCHTCSSTGRRTCSSCSGSGRLTCSPCGGRGEIICGECAGGGEINCRTCEGHGAFEKFVNLQRKLCCHEHWAFVANPRVAKAPVPPQPEGTPPPIPGKSAGAAWLERTAGVLLATVSGGQIPAHVAAALPLQAAGQAAQRLAVQSLRTKTAKPQRTLQQRLQVQRVTSLEVRYEFAGRPYVVWLHGPDAVLVPEHLPAPLTLGQSMLERSQLIVCERVHVSPNVPQAKLLAAQTAYAPTLDPRGERVLCLLDDSFSGDGAKGFVLTDQYFYFRNLVTDQPFRVALTDLRSVIPEFNDPTRAVVAVNGTADLRMQRVNADQRTNVIALFTEIADSIHADNYEPPGDAEIDAARVPTGEEQLDAVTFVLIQTALWDLAGVSKQELWLLEKQLRAWAGLCSVSLTKLEVEAKLNEASHRAHEDATGGHTTQLDRAIAILARGLKSETHARLFADLDTVASLGNGAATGQKEFLVWLGQILPAPVSEKAPGGQEQLEAVAYLMLQAALWDLKGVSKQELSQLVKCLLDWAALLSLPLRPLQAEDLLNRTSRRAHEDAEQGVSRRLEHSFAVLRRSLNTHKRARLLADLNAVAHLGGSVAEEQQQYLERVAVELPEPSA